MVSQSETLFKSMSKFSQTSINMDLGVDVEQSRSGLMESDQSSDPISESEQSSDHIALNVERSSPGLMEWEQSSDLIALDGTETFFTFSLIFFLNHSSHGV